MENNRNMSMDEMEDNAVKEKSLIGKWKLEEVKVKDNKADKTSDALKAAGWLEFSTQKTHQGTAKSCMAAWRDTRDEGSSDTVSETRWSTMGDILILSVDSPASYTAPATFMKEAPGRKDGTDVTKLNEGESPVIAIFPASTYNMSLSKGVLTLTCDTKHCYLTKDTGDTDTSFHKENWYTRTQTYTFKKVK